MDAVLFTILAFGMLMSLIALVGGLFLFLPESFLNRWLKPLVAFAAGSLVGGAFFHMLPHALSGFDSAHKALLWVGVGYAGFFALDLVLEWRHGGRPGSSGVRPVGPLLLIADGVHNLLGGLAIGAIFMTDIKAALAAWVAAALHEIPQEVGDFGAIVQAGYSRGRALLYNLLSALTFPLGGLVAYAVDRSFDVHIFVALGAGNFIYIASADLIPEIKRTSRLADAATRFVFFGGGVALQYGSHALHS